MLLQLPRSMRVMGVVDGDSPLHFYTEIGRGFEPPSTQVSVVAFLIGEQAARNHRINQAHRDGSRVLVESV